MKAEHVRVLVPAAILRKNRATENNVDRHLQSVGEMYDFGDIEPKNVCTGKPRLYFDRVFPETAVNVDEKKAGWYLGVPDNVPSIYRDGVITHYSTLPDADVEAGLHPAMPSHAVTVHTFAPLFDPTDSRRESDYSGVLFDARFIRETIGRRRAPKNTAQDIVRVVTDDVGTHVVVSSKENDVYEKLGSLDNVMATNYVKVVKAIAENHMSGCLNTAMMLKGTRDIHVELFYQTTTPWVPCWVKTGSTLFESTFESIANDVYECGKYLETKLSTPLKAETTPQDVVMFIKNATTQDHVSILRSCLGFNTQKEHMDSVCKSANTAWNSRMNVNDQRVTKLAIEDRSFIIRIVAIANTLAVKLTEYATDPFLRFKASITAEYGVALARRLHRCGKIKTEEEFYETGVCGAMIADCLFFGANDAINIYAAAYLDILREDKSREDFMKRCREIIRDLDCDLDFPTIGTLALFVLSVLGYSPKVTTTGWVNPTYLRLWSRAAFRAAGITGSLSDDEFASADISEYALLCCKKAFDDLGLPQPADIAGYKPTKGEPIDYPKVVEILNDPVNK
jgi:hypothetical protein